MSSKLYSSDTQTHTVVQKIELQAFRVLVAATFFGVANEMQLVLTTLGADVGRPNHFIVRFLK